MGERGRNGDSDDDARARPEQAESGTAAGWPEEEPPQGEVDADAKWIGPYRIVELLGEGGMGKVYLAQQEKPIRRRVAVKVLGRGVSSERAMIRFEAERQALALMNHPNIAQVYDAGSTGKGAPYFVMERVDGAPITDYCDRVRFDIRRRIELMIAVCEGVQHAHQKGIIHRDLKPSNVLVTGAADRPSPKIIDFGVAKALDDRLTDETLLTGKFIIGTPSYMAPEQIKRDGHDDIDTRADVYSLGVMLYELVAGSLPIAAQDDESAFELVERVLTEEVSPPSTILAASDPEAAEQLESARNSDRNSLQKQIKGDLDWITLKAIEKDRARRYGSAAELADDLRRHLGDEPVLARPPSVGYRLGKFVRRNSLLLAVSGVALAAMTAMGAVSVRAQLRARERAALAQEFGQQVKGIESLMRIARLSRRHDVTPEKTTIRQQMAELEERIEDLGDIAGGPGHYALGRGHAELGELDEARSHLERAWESGYQGPEVAYALSVVFGEAYRRELEQARHIPNERNRERRIREIVRDYRDPALAYAEMSMGVELDSPAYLHAQVAALEGRYDDALELARNAYQQVPWLYEARTLEGSIYATIAHDSLSQKTDHDPNEAISLAERSLEAALEVGASDVRIYEDLCHALTYRMELLIHSRPENMEDHFERGMEVCGQALEVDPESLRARLGKLVLLQRMGQYEMNVGTDPAPRFAAAREVVRDSMALGIDDTDLLRQIGLSQFLMVLYVSRSGGDITPHAAAAITALEKAHALEAKDHETLSNLGAVYLVLAGDRHKRGADPRETLGKAIDRLHRSLEIEPDVVISLNNLGSALILEATVQMERGENADDSLLEAIEALQRAIEIKPEYTNLYVTCAWGHELLVRHRIAKGGSPGDHLEAAENLLGKALELDPKAWTVHNELGAVHMARASYQSLIGDDPRPSLQAALEAFERTHAANPTVVPGSEEIARTLVTRASYDLEREGDPMSDLRRSEAWIDTALGLNPNNSEVYVLRAEGRLVEARWRMGRGRDPGAQFRSAAEAIDRAQQAGGELAGLATAADLYRWRAEWLHSRGRSPEEELARGLAAIKGVLGANRNDARAWARQGSLLLLRARATGDAAAAAESERSFERSIEINPHLQREREGSLREARRLAEGG